MVPIRETNQPGTDWRRWGMALLPEARVRETVPESREKSLGPGIRILGLIHRVRAVWRLIWPAGVKQQPLEPGLGGCAAVEGGADWGHHTLRKWLRENNYRDVLAIIEEIMTEWQTDGKQTRRNWWAILAGDRQGRSRKVAGREIPVLRAAQLREGRTVTPNAICRNENEILELKWETKRWSKAKETAGNNRSETDHTPP